MNPQQTDQPMWNQPPVDQQQEPLETAQDTRDEFPALTWEASESVHHEKDALWFVAILSIGGILTLLALFVIRSYTFAALLVVMTVALIVLAKRPPRVLQYQLDGRGITINQKSYEFHEFKAFGVVQDGPFNYISLIPTKRFLPAIDVYFPQEYGEEIVDTLGEFIPMKTMKPDVLDYVTRHLRF